MMLMYIFYAIGTLANIGLAVMFILLSLHIGFYVLIAMGVFAIELVSLFIHHRTYGNRLNMESLERIFMVVFLSSIVIAVGGIVIGWMT